VLLMHAHLVDTSAFGESELVTKLPQEFDGVVGTDMANKAKSCADRFPSCGEIRPR